MTTARRLLHLPSAPRALHPSSARLRCAALLALCLAALGVSASPAPALVRSVGGQTYGVQPHATQVEVFNTNPTTVLEYGGGPVMHSNQTYAIYWDPKKLRAGDPGAPGKYQGDWQKLINGFLANVAAESGALDNVFSLTPQYPESTGAQPAYNSTFRGGSVDTDSYPADGCTDPSAALNKNFACFTDAQLRAELRSYLAANKVSAGLGSVFFLFTPPGVTVCTDGGTAAGHCSDSTKKNPFAVKVEPPSAEEAAEQASYERSFCSYHSTTTTAGGEPLLYAAIPWTAGTIGSDLAPLERNGSDCQDGSGTLQEPNQIGLGPNGTYDHGLADIVINQVASQLISTITDPLFNGWNEPLSGNEAPDQCRNWFEGPPVAQGSETPLEHTHAGTLFNQSIDGSSYYLNTEFNQAALYYEYPGLRCELHNNLEASFTAPSTVSSGQLVGFDGAESDITLEQSAQFSAGAQPQYRAKFTWDFGDGTSISGAGFSGETALTPVYASVFHAYQYGGSYTVTLTVHDIVGNFSEVAHQITVNGPPPPEPPAPTPETNKTGTPGTTTGTADTTAGGGANVGAKTPTSPVATQAVASHSLATALRSGLVIRYSVSEQVAGRFEVLLASSTAKKLGLHGARATGLPTGTPPQTVIAKAILVTTKGGRSSYKIKFSKATAARLRKTRKVSLMIRLVVHNATSPATTTVLNTVNLTR